MISGEGKGEKGEREEKGENGLLGLGVDFLN